MMAAALASSQQQQQHEHEQQRLQTEASSSGGRDSKRNSTNSTASKKRASLGGGGNSDGKRRSKIFSSTSHASRRDSQETGMLHTPVSSASIETGPILHITGTGTFITPGPESASGSGSNLSGANARRQSATFERSSPSVILHPQHKKKRFSLGAMSAGSPVLSLLKMEGLSSDAGVRSRTVSQQYQHQNQQPNQQQQRISVSVNITPVEMLPPSPPLTRVGTNESLEERLREIEAGLVGGGHGDDEDSDEDDEDEDEVETGRGHGVLEHLELERTRDDDCSSDASWPNRLSGLSSGGDINANITSNISQAHAATASPHGDESFVAEMDITDTADTVEESTTMSHAATTSSTGGGADSGFGSTSIHGRANSPSRPLSPSMLRNAVLAHTHAREHVTDALPTPTIAVAAGIAAGIVGVGIKAAPAASASATTGLGLIGARATGGSDARLATGSKNATDRVTVPASLVGTLPHPGSPTRATAQAQASVSPMTPTRDHPLFRAPSPQPWDLVEPPATNNVRKMGAGIGAEGEKDGVKEKGKERGDDSLDDPEERKEERVATIGVEGPRPRQRPLRPKIPHSAYYFGPPPTTSAYGTDPIGQLGVHHPREIVRVERDYALGEVPQFSPAYPLELEGRITPSQFMDTISAINDRLISAHSLRWSFLDNALAILTLYISRLLFTSHYDKEMRRLREYISNVNRKVFNPVGLNIIWPKNVAFMFLEIEYY